MKGNIVASLVFFIWPIFSFYLFSKKNVSLATFICIVGGTLVLPVGYSIDIPFFPPLDKNSMPIIVVILGLYFFHKTKPFSFKDDKLLKYYSISLFIVAFYTVQNNQTPLVFDSRLIPAMTSHDIFSTFVGKMLIIIPFFIGSRVFRTYDDQISLFKYILVAGTLYSCLVLVEIRLSPQLHSWIYGYTTGGFAQQKRDGGFRATVFMGHGLWVAFFVFFTYFSSRVFKRLKKQQGLVFSKGVSIYLFVVLLLSKTLAAFLYGIFAFFVLKFPAKWIARTALVIATLSLSYPILSMSNLFPHKLIIELAESIDHERAGSLNFRFENEKILLEKAQEKLFFGWGGWGRNRVYNETGKDITVTDGRWIITMGSSGLLGFLLEFGLMMLVIVMVYKCITKNKISDDEKYIIAAHSLLISIVMIDQLPNASLKPWMWLVIGALYGRLSDISSKQKNS